jgi:putative endonuclease
MMTNNHGTLYTGVTNNLERRVYEHKKKIIKGFTSKYNVDKLIYFETFHEITDALAREKQIKGWVRRKKDELIAGMNPTLKDLSEEWRKG